MTKTETKTEKRKDAKKSSGSVASSASPTECRQKKSWKDFLPLSFASGEGAGSVSYDWVILFFIAAVLFLGVLVVNGMTFYGVFLVDERAQAMDETVDNSLVDRIFLEEVLDAYKKKEEVFQKLQKDAPNVVDPSA